MTALADLLHRHVGTGGAPGAVALVARVHEVEVAAVGAVDEAGSAPMRRDTLFRIASATKPVMAAAVMTLVDDGSIALDDPVARWLPELENVVVVRTPASPVDDVVPAERPVTVADVLSSRTGWGFPDDFTLPAVQPLAERLRQGPPQTPVPLDPDAWLRTLAGIPLLAQPGERWLYNLSSDLQGVLAARVTGRPLPEVLDERLFRPLGMTDTAFTVPAGKLPRFTSYYVRTQDGIELVDPPSGIWSRAPRFPSGAGGLVSTVDDWCAFGRMLLAGGLSRDLRRVLSIGSVERMTTNHLTPAQRADATLFLEGQGWGYGGSIDVAATDPWCRPGRYGWPGGTGTAAHVDPSRGTVAVLLTQLELDGPTAPPVMRDFWTYAADPAGW